MIYAKQIKDDAVIAILTYNYEPSFGENSDVVVITEEEYNELLESFKRPETDEISDSEALNIILGNGGATNEA